MMSSNMPASNGAPTPASDEPAADSQFGEGRERVAQIDADIQSNYDTITRARSATIVSTCATALLFITIIVFAYLYVNSNTMLYVLFIIALSVIDIILLFYTIGIYTAIPKAQSTISVLNKERTGLCILYSSTSASYFERLVEMNVTNLGICYTLVESQTDKSFIVATGVSVMGFVLIVAGLGLSFVSNIHAPNITYTTSVAGVITEFIASVFFYLYSKTVHQMKEYHDSLIAVQNVLLSLKLVDDTKNEDRKDSMVQEMLMYLIGKQIPKPVAANVDDDDTKNEDRKDSMVQEMLMYLIGKQIPSAAFAALPKPVAANEAPPAEVAK